MKNPKTPWIILGIIVLMISFVGVGIRGVRYARFYQGGHDRAGYAYNEQRFEHGPRFGQEPAQAAPQPEQREFSPRFEHGPSFSHRPHGPGFIGKPFWLFGSLLKTTLFLLILMLCVRAVAIRNEQQNADPNNPNT